MTQAGSTTYSYNGEGALVYDGTTRYAQNLAPPLSQVLQATGGVTTTYLYGAEQLAAVQGSTRTWYGSDALGSARQTLSDSGGVLSTINYDPWGTVESGTVPTFGFTAELQDVTTGLVNLLLLESALATCEVIRTVNLPAPIIPSTTTPAPGRWSLLGSGSLQRL